MAFQKASKKKIENFSNQVEQFIKVEPFDSLLLKKNVARVLWQPEYNDTEALFEDAFKKKLIQLLFLEATFTTIAQSAQIGKKNTLISSKIVYKLENVYQDIVSLCSITDSFSYDQNHSFWQDMVKDLCLTSHYAQDPKIDFKDALAIYKQWIINTFNGYAEKVLVAYKGESPLGFISLKQKPEGIYIDLIAVHATARGQGIAKSLIAKSIEYAISKNMNLFVSTQVENIAANRLYQKMGFLQISTSLIYHRHFIRSSG